MEFWLLNASDYRMIAEESGPNPVSVDFRIGIPPELANNIIKFS